MKQKQTNKPRQFYIHAFGQDCRGWIDSTVMLDGELTHVIHFPCPQTGSTLITTRPAKALS